MWLRIVASVLVLSGCGSAGVAPEVSRVGQRETEPLEREPAEEVTERRPPYSPTATWGTGLSPALPTVPPPLPLPDVLDEDLRRVMMTAFALGAPDPRHGVLHEVEVFYTDVWTTEPRIQRVHGFVLPHAPGERPFAIVGPTLYPLVSLGPPIELGAGCGSTDEACADREAFVRWRDACAPPRWFENLSPGAASLRDPQTPASASSELPEELPVFVLVAWAGDAFERAVTAHMRGDDQIARHEAHAVVRILSLLERAGHRAALRQLDYLRVAHAIAEDQDRRADAEVRAPLPEIPTEGAIDASLVPVLIEHLDEVQVGQLSQPGRVWLRRSPIVDALVRAGASAVPPLIDALESDDRLTRSVEFHRDFAVHRAVLGVYEAAYVALVEILGVSFRRPRMESWEPNLPEARAALAAEMRAYWSRFGRHPPVERRYRMLADDDASPRLHLDAAAWLTSVGGGRRQISILHAISGRWSGEAVAGGALRARRDPSVTELLVRRMNESGDDFTRGCGLAQALVTWTPADAPSLLRDFTRRCVDARCHCAGPVVLVVRELEPELLRWLFERGPYVPATFDASHPDSVMVALGQSRAIEDPLVRQYVARALDVTLQVDVRRASASTAAQMIRICDLYASRLSDTLDVAFSMSWETARRDAAIAAMRARLVEVP